MRVCGDCPNVRFEESARKGATFIRCKNDLPDIRFSYRVVAVVPTGYERKRQIGWHHQCGARNEMNLKN